VSDYKVRALVKSVNPDAMFTWMELMLTFDSLPPHGWALFGLRPVDDPNEKLPEGPLSDSELAKCIDEHIDDLVSRGRFSGAVMVAHDGKPIYSRVVGVANRRYDVPNRLDTKFNIGSMNKMFTGVAIGQLVEQGKLSFDDTVGKYLPDYPNAEVRDKVKIRHLLTHTSGMGDYWDELFGGHFYEIRTVQQFADLTSEEPLEFEPGAEFRYSNSGPIVLGLIIEKISGQTYFEYIREHVTGPAGMVNTDCFAIDRPEPNLAIGYTRMDLHGNRSDELHSNLFLHAAIGGPAGGGYSTVEDLLAFATALKAGKLVSAAMVDTLTTGKVDMGPDIKYAFLFGDRQTNDHRVVGHTGGAPGINAALRMYRDLGYDVAVLSNDDGGAIMVADKIDRLLTKD
jgi:CubicO group peptidase (beta-lactamase class C family)